MPCNASIADSELSSIPGELYAQKLIRHYSFVIVRFIRLRQLWFNYNILILAMALPYHQIPSRQEKTPTGLDWNSSKYKKLSRIHGVRCVLARTDSSFGKNWHFCMVLTCGWPMGGWMDRRTDGRTDTPSYRDARTHLKMRRNKSGTAITRLIKPRTKS